MRRVRQLASSVFLVLLFVWVASAQAQQEAPDLKAWQREPGSSIAVCPLDFGGDAVADAVIRIHARRVEIVSSQTRFVAKEFAVVWSEIKTAQPLSPSWSLVDYPEMLEAEPRFLVLLRDPIEFRDIIRDGGLFLYADENGSIRYAGALALKPDTRWNGPIAEASSRFGATLIAWAINRGASEDLAPKLIPYLQQEQIRRFVQWYPPEISLGCRYVLTPRF